MMKFVYLFLVTVPYKALKVRGVLQWNPRQVVANIYYRDYNAVGTKLPKQYSYHLEPFLNEQSYGQFFFQNAI